MKVNQVFLIIVLFLSAHLMNAVVEETKEAEVSKATTLPAPSFLSQGSSNNQNQISGACQCFTIDGQKYCAC